MTPKQEQFCREYLIDLNATQAAIRAGYSAKTANREGSRLLTKPEIQTKVAELMAERTHRTERDADEVLRRLWLIVEADLRKVFHPDGTMLSPAELPEDLAAALASIKIGETFEVKANDRLKALELLARHYGMFVERVEYTGQPQVQIYLPDNGRDKDAS